ncbi:collagen-binding domain-containing protein [Spirosoma sp.]|uniref:collagen-binding domain-containing protein n=1 Tax=Spirosoma sp. TaxID=1899569 RepID=UPI003B3B5B37
MGFLLAGQPKEVQAQNPLAPADKFNVFLASDARLTTNESDGAVAIGGNLTVAGNYQVATHSTDFTVDGYRVGLVVGGGVKLESGKLQVNGNSYAKIGVCQGNANTDALKVWYTDNNGASSNISITKTAGSYNNDPSILINQNANGYSAVCQANVIDFANKFATLKNNSLILSQQPSRITLTNPNGQTISQTNLPSQVKIVLEQGTNVWNVTGADLNKLQNLTYTNAPSANQVLIINVNASGAFTWNTPSLGGVSGDNAPYILWNFYNATSLTIGGNSTIEGSVLAPLADVVKTVNQSNIQGQLIANSFVQSGGEMHYFPFNAIVDMTPPGHPTVSISGNVFDDANGLVDGIVNGTAVSSLASNTFYVSLVSATSGKVISSTPLTDGAYSFSGLSPNTAYSVVLSNAPGTPGNNPPATSLANQVVNTGENIGAAAGNDGVPADGKIKVTLAEDNVDEVNFGVDKKPKADEKLVENLANPGGSLQVQVPTLTGSDLEDGIYTGVSNSNTIVITTLATNGTLYYNGAQVTLNQVIANYEPGKLKVDPTNGAVTVTFYYAQRDKAGLESDPAKVTLKFKIPDLTPIIYARPSTIYGKTDMTVVVEVYELNGVSTTGSILVKLSKDAKISLSYAPAATSVGGKTVNNASWTFDGSSDEDYYILTAKAGQVIAAGDILSFGLTGSITPGATSGTLTMTSVIAPYSGGEEKITNNTDADKIDFFQK